MKKTLIAALIMGPLFAACAVVPPGHRGYGQEGVVIVPLLPSIVVLDAEPYYYQSGFYYHYNNNRWFYARSKNGPWADLPRGHYPKEVRFKGQNDQHDRGQEHDNRGRDNRDDDKRDRDNRDRDNRDDDNRDRDNRGRDNRDDDNRDRDNRGR